MASPRWRKLGRDLWVERGRVALMIVAVAVSLTAVGAVLGTYAILTRDIALNYLGTRPASATLELPDGVDAALVEQVRRHPAVAEAEARDVVVARARVGEDWRPLLLFVIDDFATLRLNTFRPQSGAWPPPDGTMLLERLAVPMLRAAPGQRVVVKTPNGVPREVLVTGLVHDPGLAPAWQEREGYAYITRATLAQLGEAPVLHELRIAVREHPGDPRAIESAAAELARWLGERGHAVGEIRVPPPGQHPHQRQMTTVVLLLLSFSVLALALSAILVATSLAAMLARQVREIGVMKTLGARAGQIAGLYVAMVGLLGACSVLLAWPAAVLGARVFCGEVATMLNFTLTRTTPPWWVFAAQAAAGVLVPLLVASIPIARASRVTVRQAIDQHGVGAGVARARLSWLPSALRSVLRRPARLALTLGLLAAGGAMFMTALNVSRSWERNLDKIYESRHYDVEVRFHAPESTDLVARLRQVPGVRAIEAWGYDPAAFSTPGQIDVVHTYPDRAHGSLAVLAPPAGTRLIGFPLLAGRWLAPSDDDAVVLNHTAHAQAGRPTIGSRVSLSIDGSLGTWRLVGVVEEIGAPGVAYVTSEAFARARGTVGRARMLRIATDAPSPQQRTEVIRALERTLGETGVGVEAVIPFSELRTAVGDHVAVLLRSLIAMAFVLATVGLLGLGSTMGVSVIERTREFGVMKAIGATRGRVARMIVAEALSIGALSWFAALALSVLLTALVDALVGNLGFLAPLPLVLAPAPALLWVGLVALVSVAATVVPARRAANLSVREALVHS